MATIWPMLQDPTAEERLYDEMQAGGDVPDAYNQFLADEMFGFTEDDGSYYEDAYAEMDCY